MDHLLTLIEGGLSLVIDVTTTGDILLSHCSALPFTATTVGDEAQHQHFRFFEVQVVGEDIADHHGSKHTGTLPGQRFRYQRHRDFRTAFGRKVEIDAQDQLTDLTVTGHLQCFDGLSALRAWTSVTNQGEAPITLDYIASFALTGLAKEGESAWDEKMRLFLPHNSWQGEVQWRSYRLPEVGLAHVAPFSMKRLSISNLGTWSTSQYLPMGVLENTETHSAIAWQIEQNGSWQWELSDIANHLYLQLSGPTAQEHQWCKHLHPGETFVTVPVGIAVGLTEQRVTAFEQVMATLTQYRRAIRRPNADNEQLPVIFNDYMNCLNADPTTAKELPLIARAAEAGCEIYCIDAGWYADGSWWDSVGEWMPVAWRFPGGFPDLIETIRRAGMVPGLWLELEVMGVNSAVARSLPDDWFFCRQGKRVRDNSRFQLDFRHPEVQVFANGVVDRLVQDYGIGYIKMDYNNNFFPGTEMHADSLGDGLLQHNRAYLAWLDRVFTRYPELIIENCSSGGLRMDYALLSRQSIQSTSDQTDYRLMSVIAAAAPTAVTPEQGGVWAYPRASDDREAVITNLVNALLGRIHLSGQLAGLSPSAFALVQQAIAVYKTYREHLPHAVPLWPLGLPTFESPWACLGLGEREERTLLLAVWRRGSTEETITLPLPNLQGASVEGAWFFPAEPEGATWTWAVADAVLSVSLATPWSARLLRLTY